jgi:hypothetical protein
VSARRAPNVPDRVSCRGYFSPRISVHIAPYGYDDPETSLPENPRCLKGADGGHRAIE